MNGGQPQLVVLPDPAEVAALACELVLAAVDRALAATGRADIALAGGTTPGLLYDRLTEAGRDWGGVHLWIGDERCVAHEDPDSNVRFVRERLVAPGSVLHAPPPVGDPAKRAMAYGFQLKTRVLDLVILGLGEDAHTASLFPGDAALEDDSPVVSTVSAPKPPPERTSLSLRVLSEAQGRLLLVTGEGKREALQRALGEPDRQAPASLLPAGGTTVLADRAARG